MMFVPFFDVDDSLSALKKLKLLFLVKHLRNSDLLIIIFWFIPFVINFINHVCIQGSNQVDKILNPTSEFFGPVFGIVVLFVAITYRAIYSRMIHVRMKEFEVSHKGFFWNRRSKFWLMLFVPGFSIFVYKILRRLMDFDAHHQYNL